MHSSHNHHPGISKCCRVEQLFPAHNTSSACPWESQPHHWPQQPKICDYSRLHRLQLHVYSNTPLWEYFFPNSAPRFRTVLEHVDFLALDLLTVQSVLPISDVFATYHRPRLRRQQAPQSLGQVELLVLWEQVEEVGCIDHCTTASKWIKRCQRWQVWLFCWRWLVEWRYDLQYIRVEGISRYKADRICIWGCLEKSMTQVMECLRNC